MHKKEKYSTEELKVIARALQSMSKIFNERTGTYLNIAMIHIKQFHNETHYIDHHDRLGYKCYKKFKGWTE